MTAVQRPKSEGNRGERVSVRRARRIQLLKPTVSGIVEILRISPGALLSRF
jgi:hypothetical protein